LVLIVIAAQILFERPSRFQPQRGSARRCSSQRNGGNGHPGQVFVAHRCIRRQTCPVLLRLINQYGHTGQVFVALAVDIALPHPSIVNSANTSSTATKMFQKQNAPWS